MSLEEAPGIMLRDPFKPVKIIYMQQFLKNHIEGSSWHLPHH